MFYIKNIQTIKIYIYYLKTNSFSIFLTSSYETLL